MSSEGNTRDAEFYALVRAESGDDGSIVMEMVSTRRTRPEIGLLRSTSPSEVWVKLRIYLPRSVLHRERQRRDPPACWVEPLFAEDEPAAQRAA